MDDGMITPVPKNKDSKMSQKNICLTVAYDGTDFCGFQSQRGTGLPTVQETLEDALEKLTGAPVQIFGSGRTDSGVHAWGQVINFYTGSTIPPQRYSMALLPYLPDSITIREGKAVPLSFHARFGAKNKTYRYQYYCARQMSPFYRRYACHVPYKLDVEAMNQAAAYLKGSHDFRGFCAAATPVENFVREIYECSVTADHPEEPCLLTLQVQGNGFLWNMVRIIAGTLLEVGAGKRRPRDMPALIGLGDRRKTGKTLGPQGLFLYEVNYLDE